MKKRLIGALCITVVVSILLATCGLTTLADSGALVINLSAQPLLTVKTIIPDLDMEPAFYNVYGVGPGGETFEQLALTVTSTAQASLVPGEWEITVEAYNGDEPATLIGIGQATVLILAGAVSDLTVIVEPIAGVGQLAVDVTWPPGVLIDPAIEATLMPSGSTAADPIAFTTSTTGTSASYESDPITSTTALATGYYTLSMRLSTERADGTGRDYVWGAVEAVRIIADQRSWRLFELIEDVNRGGVGLVIRTELENPFEVTIAGVDPEVLVGMTIYAAAEPAGAESYQWYLDGVLLVDGPEILTDGNEIDIMGGLGIGHHWLSVVVTSGSVMSSTSVEFDVVREYSGSSTWGVMVWNYDVWG